MPNEQSENNDLPDLARWLRLLAGAGCVVFTLWLLLSARPEKPDAGAAGAAKDLPAPLAAAVPEKRAVFMPHELGLSPAGWQALQAADWRKKRIDRALPGAVIYVFLSRRAVALAQGGRYLRQYREVGLPRDLSAPKRRKGDNFAPQGRYKVAEITTSQNKLALRLNYPSIYDAARAVREKRLRRADYEKITAADKSGQVTPSDTVLGGPIFIIGAGAAGKFTAGDISLRPEQMEELFHAAYKGMPVLIYP